MPHVLFVNRVYPPVEGATGEVLAELAGHLAGRGWTVTVATGAAPDEPRDTVRGGVRVLRAGGGPTLVRKQGGRAATLGRVLDYVRQYPGLAAAARRAGPADVVVTKTDPPMLAVLGPVVARLVGRSGGRRVRLVHWSQDLYPDVAVALGVLPRANPLTRVLGALAARAMRRCDAVVSIGACMTGHIRARGVAPDRIAEIPNGSLGAVAPVAHADNAWRRAHDLDGRFVVMYSGNMGLAHPFEAMLGAAERLATTDPDVLWLFVGSGARKAWIEAEVARRGLANVRVLPFQPAERLAESLSAADLHVVSMEAALAGLVVPSKIYGVAAAGRPCLFLGPEESEAARFVVRCDGGTVLATAPASADSVSPSVNIAPDTSSPDAADRLAGAVRAWKHDPERLAAAGARMAAAARDGRAASLAAFAALFARLTADAQAGG